MPIRCEIVSQDRIVYQGNADMVVLPGAAGEMGIQPPHPVPESAWMALELYDGALGNVSGKVVYAEPLRAPELR